MSSSASDTRPFAIVTGASTGIGLELAKQCAANGFDLLVCADGPEINQAKATLEGKGISVDAVVADHATVEGVDNLLAAPQPAGRCAAGHAGRGLGRGFLEQDFEEARRVVDTNITGTIHLIQKVGREMRPRLLPNPDHRLDRGLHARHLPGSLQRHRVFPRFLLLRAPRRVEGRRHHRHLLDAGCDRD